MPSLKEAIGCLGHDCLKSCQSRLKTLNPDPLDADRSFQLWEETRLLSEAWTIWHDQLMASFPVVSPPGLLRRVFERVSDFLRHYTFRSLRLKKPFKTARQRRLEAFVSTMLAAFHHKDGPLVVPTRDVLKPHRPLVASRAKREQDLKADAHVGHISTTTPRNKKARFIVDVLPDPVEFYFTRMIRDSKYPMWVGWRPGATVSEYVDEMASLDTPAAMSRRFALNWEPIEINETAVLYVFEVPETATLVVPTISDAIWRQGDGACWHAYFIPAPEGHPTGILRDLDRYPSSAAQRDAKHDGCLAEALMPAIGGSGSLKPLLPKTPSAA